jgi:nucleoside-diphosphate-sugar epimerase
LPERAVAIAGNALDAASVTGIAEAGETLVHLVGTPHPNPSKAEEFERVDLESIRASVAAAKDRRIAHLVYVSVAHPAPGDARVRGRARRGGGRDSRMPGSPRRSFVRGMCWAPATGGPSRWSRSMR